MQWQWHSGKITLMVASKMELRQAILNARPHSSLGLTEQLVQVAQAHRVIASYSPTAAEPDVSGFNEWVRASGRRLLLPVITGRQLAWAEPGELVLGAFGISQPTGEPAELAEATLIVLPALAVDLAGNRLGRGGGYYDRTLSEKTDAVRLAVVFDSEILPELPVEAHDVAVDLAVSPEQTLTFS
jgi:5-formyltetrahydrofolate cyclo-ligase